MRLIVKMKCKNGHTPIKVPFSRSGFYCAICNPNSHKYYQKMKVNRISKMQAGRKKSETLSLINTIAQLEGVN